MSLPEQIQQQVDAAQAILEQHYPTTPAANAVEPARDTADPEATTPAPVVENATTPAPVAATQQEDENSSTYAQRWRSLQGVYNAQSRKVQETSARVEQLEQLIATMSAQAPQQTQQVQQSFITEDDSKEYGTDMVDFARRAAKEEVAPLVGAVMALREEIARLQGIVPTVQNVAANQRVSAQERFFGALTSVVPTWRETNNSAAFHDWLLAADPMTGITRQTYLEDAQRNYDSDRAATIFREWGRISGATDAPVKAAPNRASAELEKQVAPGRAISAPPPQAAKGREWTTSDITKFYDDVRRGAFRGREADRADMERDIFLAQREGRVVRNAA